MLASSWPKDALPHTKLLGILDHKTNAPKPEVLIGLLPTPNSYETAAFLTFGNWNDCPPPEIHVALARAWHQRYGARVVVITHEVVEFEVERTISTRLEAAEMAILHHSYCSDIVNQGVGSLEALAAVLLDARYWYFWWD